MKGGVRQPRVSQSAHSPCSSRLPIPSNTRKAHRPARQPRRVRRRCEVAAVVSPVEPEFLAPLNAPGSEHTQVSVVYKFGGSSVADAARMREVAEIICSFPEHLPCVVMSAMGKTTNLLLEAGQQSIAKGTESIPTLKPLRLIKELHRDTCGSLDLSQEDVSQVERLLTELQQLLTGLSIMQEMTPRAKDSLVSFGERLSTRIFAAFLRRLGIPAAQFDAWKLGLVTSDEFTNAEIDYSQSVPAVQAALAAHAAQQPCAVPVVTGFIGRGKQTGAITTIGRGGSDLTATFMGAALCLREVVVWKDVDGVLSSDPRIVRDARVVDLLTYDEATELAYFGAQVLHPSAMFPAQICSDPLRIRVRNSYNLDAPGSTICYDRDISSSLLTSIVLKPDVHLLDVVSTRMLGNFGFLARVFDIFKQEEISVDVVATSEISVSVTLDSAKLWSRDLIAEELQHLANRFEGVARVKVASGVSILSLICNAARSSEILKRVFGVLDEHGINVKMISQGASKTNISLIVPSNDAPVAVQALHAEFFGVTDACAASAAALVKDVPLSTK